MAENFIFRQEKVAGKLRILTGKTHSKIKLKRLQKV